MAFAATGAAGAQAARIPSIAEALGRRDAGDLAGAAQALRDRLAAVPDDGDALRVLAQLTYWLGNRSAARALYESALEQHPADTAVRLDYGLMLVETMVAARAREVLVPLAREGSGAARASTLLGRLAWWHADRSAAARYFRGALDADPRSTEARDALREITRATSPWVQLDGTYGTDDQPLTRRRAGAEAGWFPTPNWSVAIAATVADLAGGAASTRRVGDATVRARGFVPGVHVDVDAQVGMHRRSYGAPGDLVGRAVVRTRLREGLRLRSGVERLPYLHTASSLDSAVLPVTADGALELQSASGWEGEAALQRQSFRDGNAVATAYAWLLAPVARGGMATLKLGYAVAVQDAADSRFVAAQATPIADPTGRVPGRFAPYFTPDHLASHSALGALVLGSVGGTTLRVDGRYGAHVKDREPFLYLASGPPGQLDVVTRGSFARSSHPYDLRGTLDVRAGPGVSILVSAEHLRTVYYARTEARLAVIRRFFGGRAHAR